MYSREKQDMVLKAHNVSSPEYFVLGQLSYRLPFTKEMIASEMSYEAGVQLTDELGKPYPNTPEECERIVDQCIEKGWTRILTAEDVAKEEASMEGEIRPEIEFFCGEEGCLDFTESGYLLYRQICTEIFGEDHFQRQDRCIIGYGEYRAHYQPEDHCTMRLQVFGVTRADCYELIDQFLSSRENHEGTSESYPELKSVQISPVREIGPWKPNPYVTLPKGYHAEIEYEVVRDI